MTYMELMELKNSNAPTITLAGIEFFGKELDELMKKNERFIVKYRSVYYLDLANYTSYPNYKVRKVWEEHGDLPLTQKGKYMTMTCQQVNRLLGQEIFAY